MRTLQLVFAATLLLSALPALAEHGHGKGGTGPCSAYEATCKTDASVTGAADKKAKHAAMKACISAAAQADATNGAACTAAMAKHKN